ncbi:DUF4435 domain-containing protein [Bacillus safensis]
MAITKEFMKNSLKDKSVTWTEFLKNVKHSNSIHCFFEGEDAKYYLDRVEEYTSYSLSDITVYSCDGKRNLLKLHKKISSYEEYNALSKAFFIDKDYGLETIEVDDQVYITPYYSIENFYVNQNSFKRLIIKEFGINIFEDDFKKVTEDFASQYKEFLKIISPLNAFIYSFLKAEEEIIIDKFRLADFIDIKVDTVIKLKDTGFDSLKTYYKEKLERDITRRKQHAENNLNKFNAVIDKVENDFFNNLQKVLDNKETLTHGKIALFFLIKFIEDLKLVNKKSNYFSRKRQSVYIDIQSNNILSNLSQYAQTTDCLIFFLKKYQHVAKEEIMS